MRRLRVGTQEPQGKHTERDGRRYSWQILARADAREESTALPGTGDGDHWLAGGTIALEVTDIEALMAHLAREGVTLLGEVVRGPHCTMRMCLDSEGNSLLLHQLDR